MGRRKLVAAAGGIALVAGALLSAAPAYAWGGPVNFDKPNIFVPYNCSAYSTNPAPSDAGANTVRLTGTTGTVKVGFRGGGHAYINPVTHTGTAVSHITQSVVATYNVAGATHLCYTGVSTTT